MIKPMRMRWEGHVASTGEGEFVQSFDGKAIQNDTTRKTHM
jgi:hypothetical protein